MLKTAPVDIAKIDRGVCKGIQSSAFGNTFAPCGGAVQLRGHQNLPGRGGSQAELDAVQPMEFGLHQGFLLGRPCPADKFEANFGPGR